MTTDWKSLCAELLESAEELDDLMQGAIDGDYMPDSFTLQPVRLCLERVRDALAQPEPEGPTAAELSNLWRACSSPSVFARAVLARFGRPAIKPVPVAERLPGPEDCDAEGRCWWWCHRYESWEFHNSQDHYRHWLPRYALPLPEVEA